MGEHPYIPMAISVAAPQVPAWELSNLGSLGSHRVTLQVPSCPRTGVKCVSQV